MNGFWVKVGCGEFKHGEWVLTNALIFWVLTAPTGAVSTFYLKADAEEYVMAREGR